jgi:hypothetical protein
MDSYADSFAIRRTHGMEGYGIYVWLVERCAAAQNQRLTMDLTSFAWELRVDEMKIYDILTNFDLFIIEDGCIRDARIAAQMKAKSKARSEAAKKAWARKKEKESQETKTEPATPSPTLFDIEPDSPVVPETEPSETIAEPTTLEAPPEVAAYNRIVARWNEIYKGTQRIEKQLTPSPVMWSRFRETYKRHTEEEIIAACEETKHVKKFAWRLSAVLKPDNDNVQLLLSMKENRENKRKTRSNGNADAQDGTKQRSLDEHIKRQNKLYGSPSEQSKSCMFDYDAFMEFYKDELEMP